MRAQHEWPAPKRTLRAHPLTPIPPSRLLQSMNYIASHLRFHINGNAILLHACKHPYKRHFYF